jgi:hypothetical protein
VGCSARSLAAGGARINRGDPPGTSKSTAMKCPVCRRTLWFIRTSCPFCKASIIAPPRPRSVTIISWIAIVLGGLTLFSLMLISKSDVARFTLQHPFAFLRFCAGPLLALPSGVAMLRGMNWGRWVLVLWLGYNAAMRLVFGSPRLTPLNLLNPLVFGTVVYFLFRPGATAFFRNPATVASQATPDGQALCAECGGVFGVEEMVRHGSLYVCARCKPRFVQKLREGVGYDPTTQQGS